MSTQASVDATAAAWSLTRVAAAGRREADARQFGPGEFLGDNQSWLSLSFGTPEPVEAVRDAPTRAGRERAEGSLREARRALLRGEPYLRVERLRGDLAAARQALADARRREAEARTAVARVVRDGGDPRADEDRQQAERSAADKYQARVALLGQLVDEQVVAARTALLRHLEGERDRLRAEAQAELDRLGAEVAEIVGAAAPTLLLLMEVVRVLSQCELVERFAEVPELPEPGKRA